LCRWGRKRRFDQEEDPKVHGVVWREPGFVEFEDFVAEAERRMGTGKKSGRKGKGKGR
jgi:hypothetical protein